MSATRGGEAAPAIDRPSVGVGAVLIHEGKVLLIRRGMAHAIVFDSSGQVVEPPAVLRKRPLIVDRSLFPTLGQIHEAMLAASKRELRAEGIPTVRDPVALVEVSLRPVVGDPPEDADVLARIGLTPAKRGHEDAS